VDLATFRWLADRIMPRACHGTANYRTAFF
jgi:hypothetical protein